MALDYPLVNGHRYSYASIELRMKGKRRRGFTAINYSTRREHGDVEADGDRKIGRTAGFVRNEASITMLKEEADELLRDLGDEYGKQSFDVIATYSAGVGTITDTVRGCSISSVGNAHQSGGTGGLVVELGLNVMEILLNGKRI